jgi:hypothetical protein
MLWRDPDIDRDFNGFARREGTRRSLAVGDRCVIHNAKRISAFSEAPLGCRPRVRRQDARALAKPTGPIVPLVSDVIQPNACMHVACIDTAAAGGNATL